MMAEGEESLSRSCDSATVGNVWNYIDAEFSSIIVTVHLRLASNEILPLEATTSRL